MAQKFLDEARRPTRLPYKKVNDNFEELYNSIGIVIENAPYNASPDATGAVNTAGIQAAIDAASAAGCGVVYALGGTYTLASAGTHEGRAYGLMMKSGVRLQGVSMGCTTFKSDTNEDMDIIISSRTASSTNISLIDFTIDGNQANQTGSNFNTWLYDIDGLILHRVMSKDPTNWGYRLERCTNVIGNIIRADHVADVNADGFHMQDCNVVTLNDVVIDTAGDDGFIITAQNTDVSDITVDGLVITAPVTVAAAGRGVLFNLGDTAEAASQQRNFKNITVNATTYNCKGPACVLTYAEFENVNVSVTDYGSSASLYLICGSANVTGFIRGCSFDITSIDPDTNCMTTVITDGVIENNSLDLIGYNPGDGYVGVDLEGDYWTGSINVDYDPAGTKVSALHILDVFSSYSKLDVTLDGGTTGTNGIHVRAAAINNTFNIGSVLNTATNSIKTIATGNENTFIGGVIDDSVDDAGTDTKFIGVNGIYNAIENWFSPASVDVTTGTPIGSVSDVVTLLDGNVYTVVEVSGGIEVEFTFTGVMAKHLSLAMRAYYDGTSNHLCHLELYNNDTTSYDQMIRLKSESEHNYRYIRIDNATPYISSGTLLIRFFHDTPATPGHDLYIDYLAIHD